MAFGFQNCCDTEEYFYLNGIPATVSENEVYQISTLEGVDFCATYTELPELFYQPLTYTLDVMVEQTSCTTCLQSLPCPETIEVELDNNVTISNYNECSVLTELPLEVECANIQPVEGADFGQIRLQINGGQPPYSVFSANTTTQVLGPSQEGIFTIIPQASPGDYCYDVIDSYNDVVSLCCTINFSPEPLVVSCLSTPSSVWGYTGAVNLNINGESPFTVYYQGNVISLPLTQLSAGTYDFTVIDSIGQTDDITCTVNQTIPNYTYPQYLCMTFQFCNAAFYLTFLSAGTSNYLPYYTLTNPSEIGVSSMTLSADTSFNWFTSTAYSNTSQLNVPPTCSLSPASNGNVQFTKTTSGQPSPLGNWTSNGIFGSTQAIVTQGQCVEVSPSFVATPGPPVCILDGSSNGTATIIPSGGANAPYTIYVDGLSYGTATIIPNLSVGSHSVQVSDSQGNLSTVGSVTIGTTNPQNLTIDSCGQLLTNLNSTAGYLNADFSVSTIGFTAWPAGTTITGDLSFSVSYNYSGTDTDGGGTGTPLSSWLFDVGISNVPISSTINGTSIPLNTSSEDSGWQLASSTDFINPNNGQFEGTHCVVYNRTQTWQSAQPVTLTNGITSLLTSINTLIQGEQFLNPQSCTGANLIINFQLNLTNLEVVSGGCVQISNSEGLLLSYRATQSVPAQGYNAPFIGQFLNGTGCLTQPNCNVSFNMASNLTNLNYVTSVYDDFSFNPPIKTFNAQFNRTNKLCTNGSSSFPRVSINLVGGQNFVPNTTYYLRFRFSTLPIGNVGVTFGPPMNYCNPSSGNGSFGYSFIIQPSQLTLNEWYYVTSNVNLLTPTQIVTVQVVNLSAEGTNTPTFDMQISQCSWI